MGPAVLFIVLAAAASLGPVVARTGSPISQTVEDILPLFDLNSVAAKTRAAKLLLDAAGLASGRHETSLVQGALHKSIPFLVDMLDHDDPTAQESAAGALRAITNLVPDLQPRVASNGAIAPLVALIDASPVSAIQEHASAALWALTLHDSIRAKVVALGGIEPIVALAQSGSELAKGHAAGILAAISRDEHSRQRVLEAGAVSALVSILQKAAALGTAVAVQRPQALAAMALYWTTINHVPEVASLLLQDPVYWVLATLVRRVGKTSQSDRWIHAAGTASASLLVSITVNGDESVRTNIERFLDGHSISKIMDILEGRLTIAQPEAPLVDFSEGYDVEANLHVVGHPQVILKAAKTTEMVPSERHQLPAEGKKRTQEMPTTIISIPVAAGLCLLAMALVALGSVLIGFALCRRETAADRAYRELMDLEEESGATVRKSQKSRPKTVASSMICRVELPAKLPAAAASSQPEAPATSTQAVAKKPVDESIQQDQNPRGPSTEEILEIRRALSAQQGERKKLELLLWIEQWREAGGGQN